MTQANQAAPAMPAEWHDPVVSDAEKQREQKQFEGFAHEIMDRQREVAAKTGTLQRGFHAKPHAGVIAEFEVETGLPEHARHGVFSTPRTWPAVVRFSNGKPESCPDKGHEPRGIAIKLIGVPGPKLLAGQENAVTQDFLATSHSVTSAVRNAGQFMAFVRAEHSGGLWPLKLARAEGVGFVEMLRIMAALFRTVILSDVRSMVTERFFSTAPIKYGPYAVKFTVQPAENTDPAARLPRTKDFLRDELAGRLRKGDVRLDFMVQFYADDTRTPIEDTSVAWDTPLQKVAQLRLKKCDLNDTATSRQSELVNALSFSPWHATEEHRPLGNIMRARRVAYEASAGLRNHSGEPDGLPLAGP